VLALSCSGLLFDAKIQIGLDELSLAKGILTLNAELALS
jgi:hypothetical protein